MRGPDAGCRLPDYGVPGVRYACRGAASWLEVVEQRVREGDVEVVQNYERGSWLLAVAVPLRPVGTRRAAGVVAEDRGVYGTGMAVIALGQGVFDIEGTFRALEAAGFDGYTTLEIAGDEAVLASRAYLEALGAEAAG